MRRHLIPDAAIKGAPGGLLIDTPPLLEEEVDACIDALVADVADPVGVHRSRLGAGFSAHDSPVDAAKVEIVEQRAILTPS